MRQICAILFMLISIISFGQSQSKVYDIANIFNDLTMIIESGGSQTKLSEISTLINQYSLGPVPDGYLISDKNNTELPIDGHMIFVPSVIDFLSRGNNGHDYAHKAYMEFSKKNKSTNDACVETKVIGPNSTHIFTLVTKGVQEIAVVAEHYGRLSLLVTDVDNNITKVERSMESEGKSFRYIKYMPPNGQRAYKLRIQIDNKRNVEMSYAIILN